MLSRGVHSMDAACVLKIMRGTKIMHRPIFMKVRVKKDKGEKKY